MGFRLDVLAINSTDFREDNARFYYTKLRIRKEEEELDEVNYNSKHLTQTVISANVRISPNTDERVILKEMLERGKLSVTNWLRL